MAMRPATREWQRPLLVQLGWFIRLRWIAGLAVVLGVPAEWEFLRWYDRPLAMTMVGAAILGYNFVLWALMRRLPAERRPLLLMAWAQLLPDLACLTLLTLLTGGINSPLRGFFVFHMVFASLLLPRSMAYAVAAVAMIILPTGLWATGQWPTVQRDPPAMFGWIATLLGTVWLTNRITRSLRMQRRRLLRQNRRVSRMSRRLRRQQQGMIQHEKMAAAGQMAAGVAHEIANPLASIDSLLQLAQRNPEKLRPEMLATLRQQVGRINQIVRQMTAFAHPGAGDWQTLSLNLIAQRALEVLRFDPRLRRVRIEHQLAPEMPDVRIMAQAMQQVVINLLINALDAMDNVEMPQLVIRTERADGWCFLSIIDNGHGIAPEHRPHLFEPFFTTKPVGKGTGLGLSISYSLVREHGGRILVDSNPGQGARFTVKLPAAVEPPQPAPARTDANDHAA